MYIFKLLSSSVFLFCDIPPTFHRRSF